MGQDGLFYNFVCDILDLILMDVIGGGLTTCLKLVTMFTCPIHVQDSTFISVNTNETFYLCCLTHPIAYKQHGMQYCEYCV